jgi:hypothetical protein
LLKENKFSRKADLENREKKKTDGHQEQKKQKRERERERMWRWRGCIDDTKTNGCRYSRSKINEEPF